MTDRRETLDRMAAARSAWARRFLGCLVGGTGLLLVVLGSFLPWVVSGSIRRNSYAIAGLAGRLGGFDDGLRGVVLWAWPLVGPICVLVIVAAFLRRWWLAGLLGATIGVYGAGLSLLALIAVGGGTSAVVRLDPLGPSVLFGGSVLLLTGAALVCTAAAPARP